MLIMRLFNTLLLLISCLIPSIIFAQQAPFYDTPKFDTSVSHRSNLCQRQQLLYNGNITLSQALRGLNLSVVLLNYQDAANKPFFTLTEKGVIDEHTLFAIMLDEVALRAGFEWRNSFGVVLPLNSTTDGNKTYTDLLKWQVDVFDLSAGKWDQSIARMSQEIAFPEGWYDSSMVMVYEQGKEGTRLNIWSFLLPFQWTVWFLLVVTVVVSGAAYWFLERLDTTADERVLEKHPGDAVFYTAITFTGHFELRPQTSAAMILTFSTTFIALIVGAVYTANLASFLVARRAPTFKIDTVEHAALLKAPICVEAKVNIDDYLSDKYPDAVLVRKPSKLELHQALKNGECMVAVVPVSEYEQYSRYSSVNADCALQWSGKVEKIVPAGFASDVDTGTLCTSLVSHVLDLHLLEMKADGFIEREWQAYLQRTGDHNCVSSVDSNADDADETFSLGVSEMAGIFIIHLMLLVLAVLVALIQSYRLKLVQNISQRQMQGVESDGHDNGTGSPETNESNINGIAAGGNSSSVVFADEAVASQDSNDLGLIPSHDV